ncbi:DUF5646 family protein [Archaeoglobus veneficus]|uniref:Uncharacterized protein n=1 Tax=Archaeoglobus veneficus (strain DSM 11195 / SNP6) TaxID=693661 RepID=F2KQ89_ARCVS|nr:DUF5646 family protein [Archaeoglobus veneficus]AEA46522.1 hypothetical protein Arcve_0494 [Archaeoglobus veneficus SNP6]
MEKVNAENVEYVMKELERLKVEIQRLEAMSFQSREIRI